jgi:DNA repair protein RadC
MKKESTLVQTLPLRERPAWRVAYNTAGCSTAELLASIIGGHGQLEIAHALMERFQSLPDLARANAAEMAAFAGVGEVTASRLIAAIELGRRTAASSNGVSCVVQSPEDVASLLVPRMQDLEKETMVVLLLNTRNKVIGEPIDVYHGSLNASLIRVGEVLRPAVRANAAAMIVAHNHPSSDPAPSPEDVRVTKAIVEAGELLDIDVLDHLIIGRGRYTSMKSRGLGFS